MHWMVEWASRFPVFVAEASGARFTDVDGNEYVDLCLGDTGAMTGHAPEADRRGRRRPGAAGGRRSCSRPRTRSGAARSCRAASACRSWQFALTATDANRFTIRLAREATGRSKVLVHNWCYHGSVDETFTTIADDGIAADAPAQHRRRRCPSLTRPAWSRSTTSTGSSASWRTGDVACCLFEPALTNIGIVLPDDGYHDAVRDLTRRHGTFLVIDETHTLCAGPGGYTRAYDLDPDFLTVGKPLAGGIPAAAYGMSEETAASRRRRAPGRDRSTSAASAAPWPGTRSRCERCAPRSSTSSPTRRTGA